MSSEQQTPPEQTPAPNVDDLIAQANAQTYVFERQKQGWSPKQWFLSLSKTRKILLLGSTAFLIFTVGVITLTMANNKDAALSSNGSQSVATATIDTNGDGVIDEADSVILGDTNGDGVVDSRDDASANTTDSDSASWWSSLFAKANQAISSQKSSGNSQSDNSNSKTSYAINSVGDDDSMYTDEANTPEDTVIGDGIVELDNQDSISSTTSTGGTFSIVALPDTQREVQNDARNGTNLFANSMRWIVANQKKKNIQAVVHSGDVVHASASTGSKKSTNMVNKFYKVASQGFSILDNANIIYSIAPGNHDSDAICSSDGGGSVWCNDRDGKKTAKLLGMATKFDKIYTTKRKGLQGLTTYQSGRIATSYRTFSSSNSKWLILTVDYLVPSDVFKWAQNVVATHPDHNVMLVVHRYMNGKGNVMGSCEGSCTPAKKIQSDLVLKYPNVKIVVSGHAGKQTVRTDTSPSGNKVAQFQTTMHETTRNPLRLITIDTSNNTLVSRLCMKTGGSSESGCTAKKISGMKYIKAKN